MKNQWRLYLGLFFTFVIIIFAIMNNRRVSISFGFFSFAAPLVLVIFGSALLGALIVSLMVTGSYWRQKKEIKGLNEQLAQIETRIKEEVESRIVQRRLEEKVEISEQETKDPFSY
ncbi:LapA family protein [Enterococcus sp. LJL98]